MADVKIYYDKKNDNSLITKPALAENYSRRIPDNFENLNGLEVNNDHLTSLESKNFYYKVDGENTVESVSTKLNGLNNLWLNLRTKIHRI
tara:strand:+ start:331 stop:600 length:270 start_codon:yes stop_codon:yes gene_type:complete